MGEVERVGASDDAVSLKIAPPPSTPQPFPSPVPSAIPPSPSSIPSSRLSLMKKTAGGWRGGLRCYHPRFMGKGVHDAEDGGESREAGRRWRDGEGTGKVACAC